MIALTRRIATATTVAPPLQRLVFGRFYISAGAAQPLLDVDYYGYNNSNHCESFPTVLMADTDTSVPRTGVQWAFIGYPRIKKRVYADKLSKLLEVPYISMASLVRQELMPGTVLYKQIANAVNRGQLVPEDIIFGLLSKRLEDGYYRGETSFILDGIPSSQLQAEILDELAQIDVVVNFKCTEDFFIKQEEGPWKDKLVAYAEQLLPQTPRISLDWCAFSSKQ
ncbi:probable adenylate kinase 7, mitochondrial isoform X2 [Euphorbia lathyris]|uniref:probable adenylate kinase 7, mitochondrial isoform X2 n=1 Tax=Euphorbia lathyris TaxID=212925 RepID=UPI003313A5EA